MLGERLKILRNEKGIYQKKLASDLNLSQETISLYETNKREPDYETLGKIANYFNVSVDYLLGRTDIKKPMEKLSDNNGSINADDLSPESQEDLKKYIELLKLKDMQKRNSENSDELTGFD